MLLRGMCIWLYNIHVCMAIDMVVIWAMSLRWSVGTSQLSSLRCLYELNQVYRRSLSICVRICVWFPTRTLEVGAEPFVPPVQATSDWEPLLTSMSWLTHQEEWGLDSCQSSRVRYNSIIETMSALDIDGFATIDQFGQECSCNLRRWLNKTITLVLLCPFIKYLLMGW